ncbi:hypothetical protein F4680DRAFT_258703 [Xylaria scruposa]|nr:hypothetical protein F4680DRAFT_258703 [Xylaria scruposa]
MFRAQTSRRDNIMSISHSEPDKTGSEWQKLTPRFAVSGIVNDGPMDKDCPNIIHHTKQHITSSMFLNRIRTQLAVDRGRDADTMPPYVSESVKVDILWFNIPMRNLLSVKVSECRRALVKDCYTLPVQEADTSMLMLQVSKWHIF